MISMARGLGAPETVPAGNVASKTSRASYAPSTVPATVDTRCMTWLYCSTRMKSGTSTVPGTHTRPRSLRARSTSITCSARSLGSASSPSARRASSASVGPGGWVAAGGCTTGEAQQVHVGRRVGGPQHPVEVQPVHVGGQLEPLRQDDLEGVAGADVLTD